MRLAAESGPLIELAGTGHLPVGSSIIIFGLLGAMLQGVRPQFTKGRLGLPVIMIGVSTALWLAGEYLVDEVTLRTPATLTAGEYRLITGWYDAETQVRLNAVDGGDTPLPDNVAVLPLQVSTSQ